MCSKPDSKLKDVGYRLEGRVYDKAGAVNLLVSMGFTDMDAQKYLDDLPQE